MEAKELSELIKRGESSKVQFKERLPSNDCIEIFDTSKKDLSVWLFSEYFKKEFGKSYEEKGLSLEEALNAKKVMRNGHLTLAGLLFFGNEPQLFRPAFTIKTAMFIGNDIGSNNYKSKPEDLTGPIPEILNRV